MVSGSDVAPPKVNRPDYCAEIFSDEIGIVRVRDGICYLTLLVSRTSEGSIPVLNSDVAARVVLPLPVAQKLHRQLGEIFSKVDKLSDQGSTAAYAAARQ